MMCLGNDGNIKSVFFEDHRCLTTLIGEEQNGAYQCHEEDASW
jgi:hypothetical protein